MSIDTLKLYDEYRKAGYDESEAHALVDAMVLATGSFVTLERFEINEQKIRDDFSNTMEKLIQKVDIHFKYIAGIGASTFVGILVNIMVTWLKH